MLELKNVYKKHKGRLIVSNITLDAQLGEIIGLAEPQGICGDGLLRLMAGLDTPDIGSVLLDGQNVRRRALRATIGYSPVGLNPRLTSLEHLEFYARRLPKTGRAGRIAKLLELAGMPREIAAGMLTGGLDFFSQTKLMIITAALHEPRLLLICLPAVPLDPEQSRELNELLRALRAPERVMVVASASFRQLCALCGRVAIFAGGRLAACGSPHELLRRAGYSRRIRLKPLAADSGALLALREDPHVGAIERTDDGFLFDFDGDDTALAALAAALVRRGVGICALGEENTELDKVFTRLMSGA